MKEKLPELFRGNNVSNVNNNKNVYASFYNNSDILEKSSNGYSRLEIDRKIAEIFNSNDYIYKVDVTIVTDGGVMKKRIVGKARDNLITFDNEHIPISEIRDIYR